MNKNLTALMQTVAQSWQLTELKPVENFSYNYVLSGMHGKQPIILKLSLNVQELEREAMALQTFAGHGVVKVLRYQNSALLLERAVPGTCLKSYFADRDQEATLIICAAIKKLHTAPMPHTHKFPQIDDWLAALDGDSDLHHLIPQSYLAKARTLKDQLLSCAQPSVLLHGDLHHDNILANKTEWIVIDPKGVMGEPAYEVGAFMRNPMPQLINAPNVQTIIAKRIATSAQVLSIDPDRIAQWCFVQSVLAWLWAFEDRKNSNYFEQVTKLFDTFANS